MINIIVAVDKNFGIGKDNKLPWAITDELKLFRKKTIGQICVVGRKTFESIGKPLPNRTSLVLSNSGFEHEGVHTFTDVQEAFNFARESAEEELFIIGGANIYETLFPYVDKMYLSEVNFEGVADAFLKPIDFSTWDLEKEKSYDEILEHGKVKSPAWKFKVWVKKD